jgi:hypothetical protein
MINEIIEYFTEINYYWFNIMGHNIRISWGFHYGFVPILIFVILCTLVIYKAYFKKE